jgi:predicted DNA binding CopG/RHH family protein
MKKSLGIDMENKHELDREEREMLESFERGEWRSVPDKDEEIRRYASYARGSLKKNKRINIRIAEKDLESIQNMAVEEGIPYQTLIASLIHKYVTGRMVDKKQAS